MGTIQKVLRHVFDVVKARSREGLVPIRKLVSRKGKTFQTTYWIRPKDLRSMTMDDSAKMLESMASAHQHFEKMFKQAEKYLPDAAKAVQEKMQEAGVKSAKVGELLLQVGEHSRRDPVSGDALLAVIHSRSESDIPSKVKDQINKLYRAITKETYGEALELGGSVKQKIRTSAQQRLHEWTAGTWADKFKDIVGKKVAEIKGLLGMRAKTKGAEDVGKEAGPEEKPTVSPVKQIEKPTAGKEPPKPAEPKLTISSLRARLKKEGFTEKIQHDFIKLTGKEVPKNRVEALHFIQAELKTKRKKKEKTTEEKKDQPIPFIAVGKKIKPVKAEVTGGEEGKQPKMIIKVPVKTKLVRRD